MKIIIKSVSNEQVGFREMRESMDQIFRVRIIVASILQRKLSAAFMCLEKAYDKVNRKGLKDMM